MTAKTSTVIAHSLDGTLRLVSTGTTGRTGRVEIRSKLFPEAWGWCVYRQLPMPKAHSLFINQCAHHSKFDPKVVRPGE